MARSQEACIQNTHAKQEQCADTLGKLPVTLSYSICLFKTTSNYQGNALLQSKAMGENTQRGWRGFREEERTINEEERQHRQDQRLSAFSLQPDRRRDR